MNAADLAKPENALIEVCKDLLMLDLAALVVDLDERQNGRLIPSMSRERFEAMRRVAVALLAARGMAEGLRDVVVAETRRELGVWTSTPPPRASS